MRQEAAWSGATCSSRTVTAQRVGEWQDTEVEYRQLHFTKMSASDFSAAIAQIFGAEEGRFSSSSAESLRHAELLLHQEALLGAHLRILVRAPTVEGCKAAPPRKPSNASERSFGACLFPSAPVVAIGLLPLFHMHDQAGYYLPYVSLSVYISLSLSWSFCLFFLSRSFDVLFSCNLLSRFLCSFSHYIHV